MDRQQILNLYNWQMGICFRHPEKGIVDTTVVKTLRPPADGQHEVRACRDCILAMEAMRRETAQRAGREYEPGHAGQALG